MDVQEFIGAIGRFEPVPRVVLLCPGKQPRARDATFDPFRAEQAVDRFAETYVDPAARDMAYAVFYADETKPAEIVLEAETFPFLVERRVILVRNAHVYDRQESEEKGGRGRPRQNPLVLYLENPAEFTILLLIAEQLDRRQKLYKACEKAGLVVECPVLRRAEVEQWAIEKARARGKTLPESAASELIDRAGVYLSDVNNALNIATAYVGEAPAVTREDVIASCADVAEEEIWALTDAIAASNPGDALASLRKQMDYGKHPDEILGTINWLLKSAYAVASAGGRAPISAFVAKKVQPLADKLGVRKLRDAFALCTDTQFMGRTTGVDAALALELLVVKLAAPVRRAPVPAPRA